MGRYLFWIFDIFQIRRYLWEAFNGPSFSEGRYFTLGRDTNTGVLEMKSEICPSRKKRVQFEQLMFKMQSIKLKCEISKPYGWGVNFPWQAHENKCKCRFLNWATFGRVDAWNFHGAQSNRWCKVMLHKSHLNLKISGLLMLPFFSRPAVWIFCIILSDEAFKVDVALELLSFGGILVFRQHDFLSILSEDAVYVYLELLSFLGNWGFPPRLSLQR